MRKFACIAVLVSLLVPLHLAAQSWTPPTAPQPPSLPCSEIENGRIYYLRNAGCGQFVTSANNWATQISVSDDAMPYMRILVEELSSSEQASYPDCYTLRLDGTFYFNGNGFELGSRIDFPVSDTYLFRESEPNGYVDRNDQACWYWKLTKLANGNYHWQSAPGMGSFPNANIQFASASMDGQGVDFANTIQDINAEWQFILIDSIPDDYSTQAEAFEEQRQIYEARLELYDLLNKAATYGAKYSDASLTYKRKTSSLQQLQDAINLLKERLPQAVLEYSIIHATPDNPFDITDYMMTNPDFSATCNNGSVPPGWTITLSATNLGQMNRTDTNEETGLSITNFVEAWVSSSNYIGDGYIAQWIDNLPAGRYRLTVNATACQQSGAIPVTSIKGVYLFAGTEEVNMRSETSIATEPYAPTPYSWDFEITDSPILVGLLVENTNANWISADDFHLYALGSSNTTNQITALSYTREYGEENPEFNFSSTVANLEGTPSISCEATTESPVGTYPIIISAGTVTGDSITYVNGTLTITKAPLVVSLAEEEYSRYEGEPNPVFELTFTGWKLGDDESTLTRWPVAVCEANENSEEGVYPITVSGGLSQNYRFIYHNGELVINAFSFPATIAAEGNGEVTVSSQMLRNTSESFDISGRNSTIHIVADPNHHISSVRLGSEDVTERLINRHYTNKELTYAQMLHGSLEAAPQDLTEYIENPSFDTQDLTGWTTTYLTGSTADGVGYNGSEVSHPNNKRTGINGFIEAYKNGYNNLGDGMMAQTLHGLPLGKYVLEAKVIGAHQSGERDRVSGVKFFVQTLAGETAVDVHTYRSPEQYVLTFVLEEESDVMIGLRTVNTTANWVAADDFRLTYLGSLEAPDNLTERLISGDFTFPATEDAVNLSVTFSQSSSIVTVSSTGGGEVAFEGTTIRSYEQTFQLNEGQDVIMQVTPDEGFNVKDVLLETSDFIVNPDFSTSDNTGWQWTYNSSTASNMGFIGHIHTNGDCVIDNFIEAFMYQRSLGDGRLYQKIKGLPAGRYRLEADMVAVNEYDSLVSVTGVYLYMSSGTDEATTRVFTERSRPQHFTVDFTKKDAEDLEIGFRTEDTYANWVAADNFALSYLCQVENGQLIVPNITSESRVSVIFENDEGEIIADSVMIFMNIDGIGSVSINGGEPIYEEEQALMVPKGSDVVMEFFPEREIGTPQILGRLTVNGEVVTQDVKYDTYVMYKIKDDTTHVQVLFREDIDIFTVDGITYGVRDYDAARVTVMMPEAGVPNYADEIVIPEQVEYHDIIWNVKELAKYTFFECPKLKAISIPASVEIVADRIIKDCSHLAAIQWYAQTPLTARMLGSYQNPNMLFYGTDASQLPSYAQNVIINGHARHITLTDSRGTSDFYCPLGFIADEIVYEHDYVQGTAINGTQGWESLVLPFDVQHVIHKGNATISAKGEVYPFKKLSDDEIEAGAHPFWLYSFDATAGFISAASIQANVPYIIAMTNNPHYQPEYMIAGKLSFTATNAEVHPTREALPIAAADRSFCPNYQHIDFGLFDCYLLNISDPFYEHPEGSVFARYRREARPFEAYFTLNGNEAKEFISIFEQIVDRIESLPHNLSRRDAGAIYDLSGRRVASLPSSVSSVPSASSVLPQGVYITNGRKVFIK